MRRRRRRTTDRRPEIIALRCALYARYSSDQQRDASIEDQFQVCREHAEREGWMIAGAYRDAAISDDSVILRPGIQGLLEGARQGLFEVVVAEALDRVSRDQADVATLYKHLRFAGVMIVTLAEGEIDELHVGLNGTMNALFLKDLAAKTRRGLRGRVEAGKSGGGICYGYDVVKLHDEAGEPVRGPSPRAIARRLNEDGIPGPKGRLWTDSVLRGHAKCGTGLINNELYIDRLVWNRQRFMKNPDTGKRVARINPPEEWIVAEVPELRIVDDELRQAAKARQGEISEKYATSIMATRAAQANRLSRERRASGATDRRGLVDIEKKIKAMVAMIEDGGYARGMMDRMHELEARQDVIGERLSSVLANMPDIHPKIADIYRRKVEWLTEALAGPRDRDGAAEAIRGLVERIVLTPDAKCDQLHAALHGNLGTILECAESGSRKETTDTPARGMSVSVVAGAGFEPTTFGL